MAEHIITIRAGGYTARINASRGANCISLRNEQYGANILREPDYSRELDNPYLYGMPVLYPVNRISGGSFSFEGRDYRFPINEPATNCHLHGLLHALPFRVEQQSESALRCVFDGPYPGFPHRFRMELCYALSGAGLEQVTRITNLSGENMPNFLGFHTTFNIPFLRGSSPDRIRVLAEVAEEIERDMTVYLPTGRILAPDEITRQFNSGELLPLAQPFSRHYRAGGTGRIAMCDLEKQVRLVYENDGGFPWRLLLNGIGQGFICLEPMTCMANCPNAPFDRAYAGFDAIAPGQSRVYRSRLALEPM